VKIFVSSSLLIWLVPVTFAVVTLYTKYMYEVPDFVPRKMWVVQESQNFEVNHQGSSSVG